VVFYLPGYRFFDDEMPIETLITVKDCRYYFAAVNEKEHIYFVSTKDTVSFGEPDMNLRSPEEVNRKLMEIFA